MLPALELNVISVASIDDSIFGYPEINYFKKSLFMPAIKDNAYATSKFKDVNFGEAKNVDTKYYSHLFHLPEEEY